MPEIKGLAASFEKKESKFGKTETETLALTRRNTAKTPSQHTHRSTINAAVLPGAAQWETMMRKFSEAHRESCTSAKDDLPIITRELKTFPTGSTYAGTWNPLGMSGQGTYTFPHNGVVYKGGFDDGAFHGDGNLFYENGTVIKGKWNKGKLIERHLIFAEGLEYAEDDWAYCRPLDRRFTVEYDNGLTPADLTYKTADQPPPRIPYGHYDVGFGFYDLETKSIYKYDDPTSIISSPDERLARWIEGNCRSNPFPAVGPCPFLYEQWEKPTEKLVQERPPSLRYPVDEHETRKSEEVMNVVTERSSETKNTPKHRPKGELFVSRMRLNDFYDANFIVSKSDMAASRGSAMEPMQFQRKVETIKDNNAELDVISPSPSEILRKRPSVGFNLNEQLEEKTTIEGLTPSDLNEFSQKRIKTESVYSKDSLLTPSALKIYERDSEDHYKSAQVSTQHMAFHSESTISTVDITGHSKHTHVLDNTVPEANVNTQDLIIQSGYPQNVEIIVEEDKTQHIEQNVEQTPDIQDPTVGVNINTQDNIA